MKKLLKFIFNISYKSLTLIAISVLLLLFPFVILTVNLVANIDPTSLSLIWMSIFTTLTLILTIVLAIKIVTKTKSNATDSILYTKEFSKIKIFCVKIFYISSWVLLVNIVSSIFMFVTLGIVQNINVGISFFGAGIVISIIVCLLILPLILIFSLRFNEILSTSLNFIVLLIMAISFFLPIIINTQNNNNLSYDPKIQKINYTKFNYNNNSLNQNLLCL